MRIINFLIFSILITSCVYRVPVKFKNQVSEKEITELENQVIRLINDYRVAIHLPPFKQSDFLKHYAKEHSMRMANRTIPFGHYGFITRSKEISRKYSKAVTVGENVHYNNSLKVAAQIAVVKWLSSKKHLENIENDFELTGIGIVQSTDGGFYFTQLFIGN